MGEVIVILNSKTNDKKKAMLDYMKMDLNIVSAIAYIPSESDKSNATKLATYVWTLNDNETSHVNKWKVIENYLHYVNESIKRRLWLGEKVKILLRYELVKSFLKYIS